MTAWHAILSFAGQTAAGEAQDDYAVTSYACCFCFLCNPKPKTQNPQPETRNRQYTSIPA